MKILARVVLVAAVSVASPLWGQSDPWSFLDRGADRTLRGNMFSDPGDSRRQYEQSARDSFLLMEADRLRRQAELDRLVPVVPAPPRVCSVNGRFVYCW